MKNDYIPGLNISKLADYMYQFGIDYDIVDENIAIQIIIDVFDSLDLKYPTDDSLQEMIFLSQQPDKNDFQLNRASFTKIIINLTKIELNNGTITRTQIDIAVDYIYQNYNSSVINWILYHINQNLNLINLINPNLLSGKTNCQTIIQYYYMWCNNNNNNNPSCDKQMLYVINNIYDKISQKSGINVLADKLPTKSHSFKEIIMQMLILSGGENRLFEQYLKVIPYEIINIISKKMASKLTLLLDKEKVSRINYADHLIINPEINPMVSGYIKFNQIEIMPKDSTSVMWSEAEAYRCLGHTPDTGINIHCWALDPLLIEQPTGSINLSKIDDMKIVYDLNPLIGSNYPATIKTMILGLNIMRYIAGICGKAWSVIGPNTHT